MLPSGSFEAMISLGSFLFHAPMPWHAFVQNWAMGKQNVWIGVPVKWQPCMCNSRQCTKARQCKVQPHTQSNVSKWTWCHVASIGLVQQGQFCHWLTKMFLCSSFHSNFLFLSGPPKKDFMGWPCFPAKGFLHFLSFRSPQVKSQSEGKRNITHKKPSICLWFKKNVQFHTWNLAKGIMISST